MLRKRIISIIICVMLVLPVASLAVSADQALSAGDTVRYIFSIGECPNVAGVQVNSRYNAEVAELSGTPEFLVEGQGLVNDRDAGVIKWNTMINGGMAFSGEDVLVETFTVTKDCTLGDIGLSFECTEIFNHSLELLPETLVTARIEFDTSNPPDDTDDTDSENTDTENTDTESSDTDSEVRHTIFFDPGDWGSERVLFNIYDNLSPEVKFATPHGWVDPEDVVDSEVEGTKLPDGRFESFEFDIPEGHEVYVYISDPDSGRETYDTVLTTDVYGDTAHLTGTQIVQNPKNNRVFDEIKFERTGLTTRLYFDWYGNVVGSQISPNADPAHDVAILLLGFRNHIDEETGESVVTPEKVADAIEAFGTTAKDVLDAYSEIETDDERYSVDFANSVLFPEDEPPATRYTIKFDPGAWNSENILFYIWDDDPADGRYATPNGWVAFDELQDNDPILAGTKLDDGTFESFEFELPEKHHAVYVQFVDPDNDKETYDLVFTPECYGDTARLTGKSIVWNTHNGFAFDEVKFDRTGLTTRLYFDWYGNLIGSDISPYADPAFETAVLIFGFRSHADDTTGETVVTAEKVAAAINAFGTTADDVWAAYQTFPHDDWRYDADFAHSVIYPPAEENAVPGDVDGDGSVTSSDALEILRASSGLAVFTAEQAKIADLDGDGDVTSADALLALRMSLGL